MYECHVLLSRLGFQGASHSSSYSIEHSLFVLIVKQEQKSLRIFKKKSFVDVQILMKIEFFLGSCEVLHKIWDQTVDVL